MGGFAAGTGPIIAGVAMAVEGPPGELKRQREQRSPHPPQP